MIIDKDNDCFIISDYGNRSVVRWPRQNGSCGETIISDIACSSLAMDKNGYLYVYDCKRDEVKQWKIGEMNGIVVAGGNGAGSVQLSLLYFVDQDESIYISECGKHRVTKWLKNAKEGIIVAGGQGEGNSLSQLSSPRRIFVDQQGAIYAVDCGNYRVMRWLKGTTEGSIVVGGNGQDKQINWVIHWICHLMDKTIFMLLIRMITCFRYISTLECFI